MLFIQTQINRRFEMMEIKDRLWGRRVKVSVKANELNPTHCKQLNLFSVAKVIETLASSSSASHKTSSSASIVVTTQQPLTMTTLATTVTPSSNSNLPAAASSAPMKKQRPKTASPTRHGGPQQCQVTTALL
jgi:hypothetical protein